MIIDTIREAFKIVRKRKAQQADETERAHIAKLFNDRYTYRKQYVEGLKYLPGSAYGMQPRAGYAWMCPSCNKIHHPTESSVFDGLHYPACCKHPDGNRLYDKIKTS